MTFLYCKQCGSKIDLDMKRKDENGTTVKVTGAEANAIIKASFSKCPVCEYFKAAETVETEEG